MASPPMLHTIVLTATCFGGILSQTLKSWVLKLLESLKIIP